MIRKEIREYIINSILPLYAAFDKAHQQDHATKVIDESLALATHYDLDQEMVYVIAAFHDLGLCKGREYHHIVSGEILLEDKFIENFFSEEQRLVMRDAIEDHRASSAHEPRTFFGKIVAEADRVISPETTLRRTVQYGIKNYASLDKEAQYQRFLKHLTDKYAKGGYLKLWIPYSDNQKRLEELQLIIEDKTKLRSIFDTIYKEEVDSL